MRHRIKAEKDRMPSPLLLTETHQKQSSGPAASSETFLLKSVMFSFRHSNVNFLKN